MYVKTTSDCNNDILLHVTVIIFIVCMKASESEEKINTDKLKQRDKILFYADIVLFEDELSDHGCSLLNVKIVSRMFTTQCHNCIECSLLDVKCV